MWVQTLGQVLLEQVVLVDGRLAYHATGKEAAMAFELGLYTFGDLMPETQAGKAVGAQQRVAEILAAAKLADASGLDVFAVGEHHRLDMVVSATPVVLAAIAAVTERIRLASAVTILSTADPVVVFEDFATVDLISADGPRSSQDEAFSPNHFRCSAMILQTKTICSRKNLSYSCSSTPPSASLGRGASGAPLKDAPIPPRPAQSCLPIWVGTGGTQNSIVRAGALGLPLALVNISIPPAKLGPLPDLYRHTGMQAGHAANTLKVSLATHMHMKGKFARCRRHVLSVLCRLFSYPHAFALSRAGGQTGRL